MIKEFTTQDFADLIGKSKMTVMRWDREKKLKPYRKEGDRRYYSLEQVKEVLGNRFDEHLVMDREELIQLVYKLKSQTDVEWVSDS